MALLGLAGLALGAAGSIFGGIKASEAAQKAKQAVENRQKENENWYNRRYNEDATQRADAQRILTKTQDIIRKRNAAAAGTAAVMGGTEESVAAEKAANSAALADAVAQIAAAGESRKDAVEQQYMARKDALGDKLDAIENERSKAIAEAVKGVTKAGSNFFSIGADDDNKGGILSVLKRKTPAAGADDIYGI